MKYSLYKFGVILAAALLFNFSYAEEKQQREPRVAKIMEVEGTATVERNSYRYTALEGMLLKEDDIVRVLEDSRVNLRYDTCRSDVEEKMEVIISEKSPCAAGVLANASDLTAPSMPVDKIMRIDPNAAAAACAACEVQLASGLSPFGAGPLAAAGALIAGAALLDNTNKSGE